MESASSAGLELETFGLQHLTNWGDLVITNNISLVITSNMITLNLRHTTFVLSLSCLLKYARQRSFVKVKHKRSNED